MFVVSKVFFLLCKPSSLFVLLLLVGAALLWRRRELARQRGRLLLTVLALGSLALTIVPLGDLAALPLEDRFPQPASLPERIDGIVILGAPVNPVISAARGQIALNPTAQRLTDAAILARRHPEARILYSGGSGLMSFPELKEAPVAGRFLAEIGIDPSRVILEGESRNTYENALFSKRLVDPTPDQHWVLITSAIHMPRAVGVFRALDWNVIPYPVNYRTTGKLIVSDASMDFLGNAATLQDAVREWLGLIAYRLLGRTKTLFPAPREEG